MEGSSPQSSGKRKDTNEGPSADDGAESHKRLKRQLTQESDLKVSNSILDDLASQVGEVCISTPGLTLVGYDGLSRSGGPLNVFSLKVPTPREHLGILACFRSLKRSTCTCVSEKPILSKLPSAAKSPLSQITRIIVDL